MQPNVSGASGSLDDYLKFHAGPKTSTTFAQKEVRQYDFSAVDSLDSDRQPDGQTHARTMNAANGPKNGFAGYDGEDASETSFSSASKRAPKKEL